MENLTDYQKEFLLEHFFKTDRAVGWVRIARQLLEKGKCIVAGTEPIWLGGIGNFIKCNTDENFIECLVYNFDLKYFLTSSWYQDYHAEYLINLINELMKERQKYLDISKLK